MPFRAVIRGPKWWNQLLSPVAMLWQHTFPAVVRNFFFFLKFVFIHQQVRNPAVPNFPPSPGPHGVLFQSLRPSPVLSHVGSVWRIYRFFPLFLSIEVFYVWLGDVMYMNIQCRDFLLNKKFCLCSLLKHAHASHELALKYDRMMGAGNMISILTSHSRWN